MSEIYLIADAGPTPAEYGRLCLDNNLEGLERLHKRLRDGTRLVANSLRGDGFTIINCSAGNVTGHAISCSRDSASLRDDVASLLGKDVPFRFGVGSSLKDAYLAAFKNEGQISM